MRYGKTERFWGCSNYPECRHTCRDLGEQPEQYAYKNDAACYKPHDY